MNKLPFTKNISCISTIVPVTRRLRNNLFPFLPQQYINVSDDPNTCIRKKIPKIRNNFLLQEYAGGQSMKASITNQNVLSQEENYCHNCKFLYCTKICDIKKIQKLEQYSFDRNKGIQFLIKEQISLVRIRFYRNKIPVY